VLINQSLKDGFASISDSVTNVKDAAGAATIVDSINIFSKKFDGLPFDELKDKSTSISLIADFIKRIADLVDRLPDELKSIVQPAIDGLVKKLTPFSR
jgi:hypothetical protein